MNTSINLDQTELSIIIPIYFHKLELYQVIDRCIKLVKELYPQAELILVDDASPLDTSDWPITFRKEKNSGFTQTVNIGLNMAGGEILVVMNDDISIKEGQLDRFLEIKDIGIYSPKTTDEGPGDYFGSLWGMNRKTFEIMGNLDENFPHYYSDTEYYNKAKMLNIPIVKWEDIMVEHIGKMTYGNLD